MRIALIPKSKPFYGWFIVFLAFLSVSTYGVFYSYSAFIKPLEAELETTRAGISAAYTIFLSVYSLFAIPMGWLCDRYGPRKTLWLAALLIGGGVALSSRITSLWQLYLLFGIMAGMGHGAIFVVPTSTVTRWFIQRRGLAVGLTICGLGVGLLVLPPIAAQFIETQGWRATFVLLGVIGFTLNMIVGTFIKRRPEDKGLQPYGYTGEISLASKNSASNLKDYSVAEAVRTRTFWTLYFVCALAFAAEQMVLVHIIPYSGTIGISPTTASLGLSFLGAGTVIGRVGTGALSDRIGRIPVLVMGCCIETAAIFILIIINSPLTLYLTMLFLGFGYGGWVVLTSVILGDYFGLKNLGAIMGVYFTSGVPTAILGPLMAGIVYDFTSSYFLAIVIAGVISIVAIILAASIKTPRTSPVS